MYEFYYFTKLHITLLSMHNEKLSYNISRMDAKLTLSTCYPFNIYFYVIWNEYTLIHEY